jgi:hypothetical protein
VPEPSDPPKLKAAPVPPVPPTPIEDPKLKAPPAAGDPKKAGSGGTKPNPYQNPS